VTRRLLILTVCAVAVHGAVALAGDLRGQPWAWLCAHVVLFAISWAAWREVEARRAALRAALAGAVLFRVIAALGAPAMSDDVYRYVWDGRVLAAGFHPYAHPPDDAALAALRDGEVWPRINHPSIPTIYPPLAQLGFGALAGAGAGVRGFKLAMAVCDLGVVLALLFAARVLQFDASRVVLYAWSPLAILESAGSGHVEPAGIALAVLAVALAARGRAAASGAAVGAAAQIKLFPIVLLAGVVRCGGWRAALAAVGLASLLAAPFALHGPAVAPGTYTYGARWERNATVFAAVEAAYRELGTGTALAPAVSWARAWIGGSDAAWTAVYRACWPGPLARGTVAVLAALLVLGIARWPSGDPTRDALRVFVGVLVLSPTVHPWYVLWAAPFAAAVRSVPALLWTASVPLAYFGADDVPWLARIVEYGVPAAAAGILARGSATMRS